MGLLLREITFLCSPDNVTGEGRGSFPVAHSAGLHEK